MNEIVSPVVDRIVGRILTIPSIGVVRGFNPFARSDIADQVVAEIDGVRTLRCWWVQGPTMTAVFPTQMSPPFVHRTWTYEVHGIEGVAPAWDGDPREPGAELNTLRDNAALVTDVLDADDLDMGGLVHSTQPCKWSDEPLHVAFGDSGDQFVVAYAVITKVVTTMRART